MALPKILHFYSLTQMVERVPVPLSFLRSLVLRRPDRTLHTKNVAWPVRDRTRTRLPFVEEGAPGVLVGRTGSKMVEMSAPNIRVKKPFRASELLVRENLPLVPWNPTEDEHLAGVRDAIAQDLEDMVEDAANTEEWMVSQAIQGTLAYTSDTASFSLNYGKPAAATFNAANFIDTAADPGLALLEIIDTSVAKQQSIELLTPTHAVGGSEFATYWRSKILTSATIKDLLRTDMRGALGRIALENPDVASGARYLGTLQNIDFWSYPTQLDGVDLIRPKYLEFIHSSRASGAQMLYAAVEDMDLVLAGRRSMSVKRFVKSWLEKDPSALMQLLHSRPVPALPRPAVSISCKAISG